MKQSLTVFLSVTILGVIAVGCRGPTTTPSVKTESDAEILSLAADLSWKLSALRLLEKGDTNQLRIVIRSSLVAHARLLEAYLQEHPHATNAPSASNILERVHSTLGSTNKPVDMREMIKVLNDHFQTNEQAGVIQK